MTDVRFPEDDLVLLGQEIATQTPQEYYDRISNYYANYGVRAKAANRRPVVKALPIKGVIKQTATKKRSGIYEVMLHGELIALVLFNKEKRVLSTPSDERVITFLKKKKFSFDDTKACVTTNAQELTTQ